MTTAKRTGAHCIGLSLGMLGGGGSILTVPILTYVAGMAMAAFLVADQLGLLR